MHFFIPSSGFEYDKLVYHETIFAIISVKMLFFFLNEWLTLVKFLILIENIW
jgi:hypothetical protein